MFPVRSAAEFSLHPETVFDLVQILFDQVQKAHVRPVQFDQGIGKGRLHRLDGMAVMHDRISLDYTLRFRLPPTHPYRRSTARNSSGPAHTSSRSPGICSRGSSCHPAGPPETCFPYPRPTRCRERLSDPSGSTAPLLSTNQPFYPPLNSSFSFKLRS